MTANELLSLLDEEIKLFGGDRDVWLVFNSGESGSSECRLLENISVNITDVKKMRGDKMFLNSIYIEKAKSNL